MATLIITPTSGTFLKDYDSFGKMDPFVRVTIGTEVQKTETAYEQGKTPVWKHSLTFKLTKQQFQDPDSVNILIEAFDEDTTSNEFIGSVFYTLSQIESRPGQPYTIELYDRKGNSVGTIDVAFELKTPTSQLGQSKSYRHVIGTVVIQPREGRFDIGVSEERELYFVFLHAETAYQTSVAEGTGKRPVLNEIISFPFYDGQDMIVRCFDDDSEKEEMIGEGHIQLPQLHYKGRVHNVKVPIVHKRLVVGELNVEIEFLKDIFENPVKVFPVLRVPAGGSVAKKIQYTNPDRFKKNLTVHSDNPKMILVKTEKLSILPSEFGEIRFKIFGPSRGVEEKCRIDIAVEDTNIVEESLLFKVEGV